MTIINTTHTPCSNCKARAKDGAAGRSLVGLVGIGQAVTDEARIEDDIRALPVLTVRRSLETHH